MTSQPLHILLIEDNEAHGGPMREELEHQLAATVTVATSGEAGLDQLANGSFDVVVTDFRLPDMDGLAVLEKIQSLETEVPVVLVTGMGDELVCVRALKMGAYDYVVKGRNLDFVKQLPEAVGEALKSFRGDRERERLVNQLQQERQRLAELSIRDDLTELYNRRHLSTVLSSEFARARRHGHPLSVMMADIDNLKEVNRRYGHHCGSAVIRHMAALIRRAVRISDQCFRYGGDEFLLVLPSTGKGGALALGDRLCELVVEHPFDFEGQTLRVTISSGAATLWQDNYPTPEALVRSADQALFEAKAQGGNKTVYATGSPETNTQDTPPP